MIKAVFFDIDGTLFEGSKGIPKSTLKDLDILKRQGIKRVICTGRDKNEIKVKELVDIKFDAYITTNGQICLDDKMNIFFKSPIDKEDTKELVKMFNKKDVPISLCNENGAYINFINDYVKEAMKNFNLPLEEIGTYKNEELYKAMIFGERNVVDYLRINERLKNCYPTFWNEDGMDIVPRHGGKEVGIKAYLEKENIKIEEAMAIGDSDNDIGMIKEIGIGVAMGNAIGEIKNVADYVTANLYDDGIDKALRHFGVIND